MRTAQQRSAARIAEVAARQLDLAQLWREVATPLAEAVPHYWTPCWYTVDPDSLLVTSHFHDGLDVYPQEWLEAEYVQDDVHQIRDVLRSDAGLSTLHEATGGDPSSTARWQANMAMGGDQELILRLRSARGVTWGALGLYREPDRPLFDDDEKHFLRTVAPALAGAAQRALLLGEALQPDWPDGPGLVVIGADDAVELVTETASRWLDLLATASGSRGRHAALASVTAAARGGVTEADAQVRVRCGDGRWVTLRAAKFLDGDSIGVIIEPTRPVRIFDLLMRAHGLTEREREVVQMVIKGHPTTGIAAALHLSPYTVQEHLTSVFDKMGVRSRRELVAQAFFSHYAPRFRDNESRTTDGLPMRGNPALPASPD